MVITRRRERSYNVSDLVLMLCVCMAWRMAASATSGTFNAQVIGTHGREASVNVVPAQPKEVREGEASLWMEEKMDSTGHENDYSTPPSYGYLGYVENYGVCGGLGHTCSANEACAPCQSEPDNYFEW